MGKLNAGLTAYLAKKNGNVATPTNQTGVPMLPMNTQMMTSIKQSPKGKLPAGLQRYLDNKKKGVSVRKPKKQGKGIVKALGQKGTTGNFKKIAKKNGLGAAIGALQNKLAKKRGQPLPFTNQAPSARLKFKKRPGFNFKKAERKLGVVQS